jgi:hypothetical protein
LRNLNEGRPPNMHEGVFTMDNVNGSQLLIKRKDTTLTFPAINTKILKGE